MREEFLLIRKKKKKEIQWQKIEVHDKWFCDVVETAVRK